MVVTKTKQIKSAKSLSRAVDYIMNGAKTMTDKKLESETQFLSIDHNGVRKYQMVSGHGLSNYKEASTEFLMLQSEADLRMGRAGGNQDGGTLAHHVIQSFATSDDLSPEEIHEIGRKTALELTGGKHQFIIATHLDKGHIHNHIIFNATDSVTLKKFRWQKGTAQKLRNISDKHSDIAGAMILDSKMKMNYQSYSAYKKQESFSSRIKSRIDFLLKYSTDIPDFLAKARRLNLLVDFSGKYATYLLMNEGQKKVIRDRTLSKKGKYSQSSIEEILQKNEPTISIDDIEKVFDKFEKDLINDFELKVELKPWQVIKETDNGLYISVDFGISNTGTVLIPSRCVDKLDNGNYELYIKKNDFFYFMNEEKSDLNRYMKGEMLTYQLSRENRNSVLRKNPRISKIDQIIKEFEFLSLHNVTGGRQFEELVNRFETEVVEIDSEFKPLDNRISKLNIVAAALDSAKDSSDEKYAAALEILKEQGIPDNFPVTEIRKLIDEVTNEKSLLKEYYDEILTDYNHSVQIKENVEKREKTRISKS
ncbi:TPA: relaxase/mobilization nuclease domain-containing protein [Streptococcus suis]